MVMFGHDRKLLTRNLVKASKSGNLIQLKNTIRAAERAGLLLVDCPELAAARTALAAFEGRKYAERG